MSWDITPGSPLKVTRRIGGTYRLHHQGRRASQVSSGGCEVLNLLTRSTMQFSRSFSNGLSFASHKGNTCHE
jgi:hypothetical protein